MSINIKRAVQENVTFVYYRDSALWYKTAYDELFPVPIEEAGSSTFNHTEKGMFLMRWMRKWNNT